MNLDNRDGSPLDQSDILSSSSLDGGEPAGWVVGGDAIVRLAIRTRNNTVHDVRCKVDESKGEDRSSRAGSREWQCTEDGGRCIPGNVNCILVGVGPSSVSVWVVGIHGLETKTKVDFDGDICSKQRRNKYGTVQAR